MKMRLTRIGFLLAVCCLFVVSAKTQTLSSVSTRWSDSFVEWEIYATMPTDTTDTDDPDADSETPQEELYGEFKLRWLNVRNDFSEWDYELGSERGAIRQKWKDDPTQWELRSYTGNIVTIRTMWANDLTEWRVTDNSVTLNLKSRWKNQLDEWLVDDATRGSLHALHGFGRHLAHAGAHGRSRGGFLSNDGFLGGGNDGAAHDGGCCDCDELLHGPTLRGNCDWRDVKWRIKDAMSGWTSGWRADP